MAIETPGFSFSLEASGDLSASQFRALVADSVGQAAVAGAGVAIVGVLQNDPSAVDRAAGIMNTGITKMVSGAAVAAGAGVETDAVGRAITLAAGVRIGTALEASAALGEIIAVLLD